MQAAMETFTQARTLSALITQAETLPGMGEIAANTQPQAANAPSFDLKAALLTTVADLTGYPEDMLGLDQDLEAELGIDSIKRVEILGALQEALPTGQSAAVAEQMESFIHI